MTVEAQGNYPNFKQNVAEKENLSCQKSAAVLVKAVSEEQRSKMSELKR